VGVVSLPLVVTISSLTHINFTHFWQTDPPADESPISISVEPETATLTPGGQQTFECEANNSATLRWTYNGGLLPENALAVTTSNSSSALTIMMATVRNSGVYACLGHSPSEAFSDVAVVTVDFYGMYNLLWSVTYIKTSYFCLKCNCHDRLLASYYLQLVFYYAKRKLLQEDIVFLY